MRLKSLPLLLLAILGGETLPPIAAQAPRPTPAAPARSAAPAMPAVAVLQPIVVARYPHDPTAFTEGLIWDEGMLVESVGFETRSDVRRVALATGKVVRRAPIPAAQFGEGVAAWQDELISLTWHDGIAHRWARKTLTPLGTSHYTGEGWGLASVPDGLVRSDGSATLTFCDPVTMEDKRRIQVTLNGHPITQLNELEWVSGALLANVWHQPFLLRIDPASGRVTAVIDLRAIVAEVAPRDPEAVANGIAWDAKARRLFITGKFWPTLFEIKIAGL